MENISAFNFFMKCEISINCINCAVGYFCLEYDDLLSAIDDLLSSSSSSSPGHPTFIELSSLQWDSIRHGIAKKFVHGMEVKDLTLGMCYIIYLVLI